MNVETVYCIKKRLGETGSVADRPRSGRPKKTSVREDRALVRYSLSDRRLTSPELRQRMELELGVTISSSTIRKRLNSNGLRGCVAVKKPLLRPANVNGRLEFARRHKNWTVQQWDTVLWSDESAFQLFCGAKRAIVRRRVGTEVQPTVHFPHCKAGRGLPGGLGVHV